MVVPHRFTYYLYSTYIGRMFGKQINNKNDNSDKQYIYYRLVHTYKIGNKVRHQNILSLGRPETLPRERHKALADRIEELVRALIFRYFQIMDILAILIRWPGTMLKKLSKKNYLPLLRLTKGKRYLKKSAITSRRLT